MTSLVYLSIVIPTCERNEMLAKCLVALKEAKEQNAEVETEVIITDDGRQSNAKQMIEADYPWAIWVQGPQRGPAANRNNGAHHACGEWLVFIDDDCLAEKNWLKRITKAAKDSSIDVIEGKTVSLSSEDHPLVHYIENMSGGLYWSCNLAIRRSAFRLWGGFDEDFLEAGGEDMELAYRIKKMQVPCIFLDDAVIFHPVRYLDWRTLFWRSRLMRWKLLYDLKTGQGLSLSTSDLIVTINLSWRLFIDLFRTTYHLLTKHEKKRWRKQVFDQFWKWLIFPFTLPYLLYWELRFRQQLKAGTLKISKSEQGN